MRELCGGQTALVSAGDHVAGLADVGEGSMEGMNKKERKPVALPGASC